jgi:hypothetical protein
MTASLGFMAASEPAAGVAKPECLPQAFAESYSHFFHLKN